MFIIQKSKYYVIKQPARPMIASNINARLLPPCIAYPAVTAPIIIPKTTDDPKMPSFKPLFDGVQLSFNANVLLS